MMPLTNLLGEQEKHNNKMYEAKHVQMPLVRDLRKMISSGYIFKLNPDLVIFRFTSTGNTNAGNAKQGSIQKGMGYQAGWLDLTFVWKFKGKRYEMGLIECKYGDGDYSDSQKEMAADLAKAEIPHGKAYTLQQGLALLREWGIKC